LRYGSLEVSSVPSFFLQTGYRFCNRPFAVVPRTIALVLGLAVAYRLWVCVGGWGAFMEVFLGLLAGNAHFFLPDFFLQAT
jgi:hypothetical protein